MDISKLVQFNEWWTTGKVRESLLKEYKRPLFGTIVNSLKDRQITLLYGLRRVGKTTLFYQLIDELLKSGVTPKNILYFSFDEFVEDLNDLVKTYEVEVLRTPLAEAGRVFIFFDEVQKLEDWQNKIKIFYDLYPNIKFFLSGSASITIQKKANESLAGRLYSFMLKPLSFSEFLALKNVRFSFEEWNIYESRVLPLFHDFLRKGGFPEIINEKDEDKISDYIKNAVIERILMIDLPSEFGLKDPRLLKTLVEMTAHNTGFILNYDSVSKSLQQSKPTLINYVNYLEYAIVIKLVKNLRRGFLSTSRKMKKMYFSNAAFCFPYSRAQINESNFGKIIENAVLQETDAEYYYREGSVEIDFILKTATSIIPVEVKYGKEIDIQKFASIVKALDVDFGLIITKDFFKDTLIDGVRIVAVPVWVFLSFKEKFLK